MASQISTASKKSYGLIRGEDKLRPRLLQEFLCLWQAEGRETTGFWGTQNGSVFLGCVSSRAREEVNGNILDFCFISQS